MTKVVCIVSGGMDSVTLLHKAVKELGKENVHVLNFHYGSKHNNKERPMAKKNAKKLGVPYTEINLDYMNKLWKSDLLKSGGKIPEGHYAESNMKATVVPFRNGILLANAIGFAESVGADEVWYGNHAGDHVVYPDCRLEFTQLMNKAGVAGTYNKVRIVSPFVKLSKADIVKIGRDLGVNYRDTWSCYVGGWKPCLKCGTCIERAEAFHLACYYDPLLSFEDWHKAVDNYKEAKEKFEKEEKK